MECRNCCMASHNELGKQGEEIALCFLRRNGFEILQTNWVAGKAEIDIIAVKQNVLSIVEVKTRSSAVFGLPQEFVTQKKIRMMRNAVNAFAQQFSIDFEVRFDIIAITKTDVGFEVEHLADAFYYF